MITRQCSMTDPAAHEMFMPFYAPHSDDPPEQELAVPADDGDDADEAIEIDAGSPNLASFQNHYLPKHPGFVAMVYHELGHHFTLEEETAFVNGTQEEGEVLIYALLLRLCARRREEVRA